MSAAQAASVKHCQPGSSACFSEMMIVFTKDYIRRACLGQWAYAKSCRCTARMGDQPSTLLSACWCQASSLPKTEAPGQKGGLGFQRAGDMSIQTTMGFIVFLRILVLQDSAGLSDEVDSSCSTSSPVANLHDRTAHSQARRQA